MREGNILKKCDRASHRPDSNKACAAGTCQHTCDKPDRCQHAWTLRYSVNGKQREESFKDDMDGATGRIRYGSGKRKAQDAQLKLSHDKRAQGATFIDHARTGRENFGDACEAYIAWLVSAGKIKDSTRIAYTTVLSKWVRPRMGHLTLAQAALAQDEAEAIMKSMSHLTGTRRASARLLITGTLDKAIKAEKISRHKIDIEIPDMARTANRADFIFPTFGQIEYLASKVGISVWLMRGCGLRISEALAVEKSDFRPDGKMLRVWGQRSRTTGEKVALKHRKDGQYRDVPVPSYLWEMVKDLPDGPLCPGKSSKYAPYPTIQARFTKYAAYAHIPTGFTPHSLRHLFASTMLAQKVQITDVAKWLGHQDINVTYAIYGHLLPNAADTAVAALDAEYEEWSKAA